MDERRSVVKSRSILAVRLEAAWALTLALTVWAGGLLAGDQPAGEKPLSPKEQQRLKFLEAGKARDFPKVPWANRIKRDTAHYHIEANVPEDTVRYIHALSEAMYTFYGQRLGGAPKERMNVYIYAAFEDFAEDARKLFQKDLRPGESGFFAPHPDSNKRGLFVPWVAMRSGLEPAAILLHEGFHQFYHSIYKTQDPRWFNEALATQYENARFDGEKITDGFISPSKLKGMQVLFKSGKNEPLAEMMKRPREQFLGDQYCEAWSFLFWVLWGQKDAAKRADTQRRFRTYFAGLENAKNHTIEAFENTMGIKLADAEGPWKEFILSLNPDDPYGGLGDPNAKK